MKRTKKEGVGGDSSRGQGVRPPQLKRKKTSVLLAVFLGFWSWLYTWRKDWPQFVVGVVLHCVVAPALFWLGAFADIGGFAVQTSLICAAVILQLLVWFAAILDAVATPSSWYVNYPNVSWWGWDHRE